MKKKLNKRLNRYEYSKPRRRHAYIKDNSGVPIQCNTEYLGFIKCKLVHREASSVVYPDQIFVELGGELRWIQPLFFGPNLIIFQDEHSLCRIPLDISCGVKIWCEFKSTEFQRHLKDGSLIYRCKIEAPNFLYRYTTGRAKLRDSEPLIELFHHTHAESARSIRSSQEFWSSAWNIQGTKKLENIGYLYLTVLPKIHCDDDLFEIAMSSKGVLPLRLDQNMTNRPDIELEVYRDSTESRTETIACWVFASDLTTQPVYKHNHISIYYEVVCSFIHRVGVDKGTTIGIEGNVLKPNTPKDFDYCVIGDASTLSGLQAPLDEDSPEHIFKIEKMTGDQEIMSFWVDNQNSDQYLDKHVELAKIEVDEII